MYDIKQLLQVKAILLTSQSVFKNYKQKLQTTINTKTFELSACSHVIQICFQVHSFVLPLWAQSLSKDCAYQVNVPCRYTEMVLAQLQFL